MANVARTAVVVLMAIGTVLMAGRADAQDESSAAASAPDATVLLRVFNHAALSKDVLDVATARVSLIYERIGVRIVWVADEVTSERRQDGRLLLNILLLSHEMAEKKIKAERIKSGVLGQAHTSARRASIFCDRIAATPGGLAHFSISLGDIIAHEVGHLLLGPKSHSLTGIMRANINVRTLHLQTFDESQARTIRSSLNDVPRFAAR